jgi:hypothetical protein
LPEPQAAIDLRRLLVVDQAVTYGAPDGPDRLIDVAAGIVVKSAPVSMRPLEFAVPVRQSDRVTALVGGDTV